MEGRFLANFNQPCGIIETYNSYLDIFPNANSQLLIFWRVTVSSSHHIPTQQPNISWKDPWDIIFAVTGGGDWYWYIAHFWPILIVAPDGDGCNSTSTIVRQLWANWLCVNIYYIYRLEYINSHTTYYAILCMYIHTLIWAVHKHKIHNTHNIYI